jgi:hypothetical protein
VEDEPYRCLALTVQFTGGCQTVADQGAAGGEEAASQGTGGVEEEML